MPKLVTDPIWSLRPYSVSVEVGSRSYEIPAASAADWLTVLMNPNLTADHVFPGMLTENQQAEVERYLHQGGIGIEEYLDLGWEVVSEVSGRPWWIAMRMIMTAVSSWDAVGGELIRKIDAERVSIAGWLDVLFPIILQGLEDSKRSMYLLKLEQPPDGWGSAPEEMEMSTEAFLAMAS